MNHANLGAVVASPAVAGALRQSLTSWDEVLEGLPVGIYTCDSSGRLIHYNQQATELWGRSPGSVSDALYYCGACKALRPDGTPLAQQEMPMAELLANGEPLHDRELLLERPDGTRITVRANLDPILDQRGRLVGGVSCLQDITAVRRAEQRQKLLIDELNHRVKNTLATVQSLAAVTAGQAASQADFLAGFQARLAALSKAHDQLTRRQWRDADLRELLATELAACCPDADRISLEGAETRVRPSVALTLALLFHELAANAVKFGALSLAAGKVTVSWRVHDGELGDAPAGLEIEWRERGGPAVKPPQRHGFGSLLLERSLRSEHGGSASIEYCPDGVRARIRLPLEQPPPDWEYLDRTLAG